MISKPLCNRSCRAARLRCVIVCVSVAFGCVFCAKKSDVESFANEVVEVQDTASAQDNDTLRYRHPLWEQRSVDSLHIICSDCNQIDSNGLKQGLWVDIKHGWRYEQNYNDGVRSGIYRQFGPRGDLAMLGEYINGRQSGIWYIYDREHLRITCEQFGTNHDTVTQSHSGRRLVPEHRCYSKSYHDNGNVKDEGWVLWFEGSDFLMDDAIEYGTWKYYNEEGELINTREYDSY